MRKIVSLLLAVVLMFALCACQQKVLTKQEAIQALKEEAEPQLAGAIGVPSDLLEMDDYKIDRAVHDEAAGKWYFDISGSIPMYTEGLWWITYSFDATVDDTSGAVTLGGLKLDYGIEK